MLQECDEKQKINRNLYEQKQEELRQLEYELNAIEEARKAINFNNQFESDLFDSVKEMRKAYKTACQREDF